MNGFVVFWIIGFISLLIELFLFSHTYKVVNCSGNRLEKFNLKIYHFIGLLIINVIPFVNLCGLAASFMAFGIHSDEIKFKMEPPDYLKDEVKTGKLNKFLNKKL